MLYQVSLGYPIVEILSRADKLLARDFEFVVGRSSLVVGQRHY